MRQKHRDGYLHKVDHIYYWQAPVQNIFRSIRTFNCVGMTDSIREGYLFIAGQQHDGPGNPGSDQSWLDVDMPLVLLCSRDETWTAVKAFRSKEVDRTVYR